MIQRGRLKGIEIINSTCVRVCLASGSVWCPARLFTAYMDLLCPVNRLVRGSIVPAANTAAVQLTPGPLKSQIPPAIIPQHPTLPQPLTGRFTILTNVFYKYKYRYIV